MKYLLSETAARQIAEIYGYGAFQFGIPRAQEYEQALYQAFERLTVWNHSGKDVSEYRPGLRQYRHAKHYILYTIEDSHIYILRIEHTSSNIRKHFEDY